MEAAATSAEKGASVRSRQRASNQIGAIPRIPNTDGGDATSCRTFQDFYDQGIITAATLRFAHFRGFIRVSPVQEITLPTFIQKKQDVAVEACTGSGKTLAFLIPIVEMLWMVLRSDNDSVIDNKNICNIGAVVLAPTRELVIQIHEVLQMYLKFVEEEAAITANEGQASSTVSIASLLFTGGNDTQYDINAIESATSKEGFKIIIATPGRLSHLLEIVPLNRSWTFRNLEVLIFDEADRLLLERASFEHQLATILAVLPKQRRTGLFSATLSAEMKGIIKAGMRNPTLIRVSMNQEPELNCDAPQGGVNGETMKKGGGSNPSLPTGLFNYFAVLSRRDKFAFLLKFLFAEIFPEPVTEKSEARRNGKKRILFFLTCNCVKIFYAFLREIQSQKMCPLLPQNVVIERLFGKMEQKSRLSSCKRFASAPSDEGALLIATDIAARGLDFPDIQWIVQFDAPLVSNDGWFVSDPVMYIHRIGRTARAGRSGSSLLLISPSEEACIPFLENRQVALKAIDAHPWLLSKISDFSLSGCLKVPQRKGLDILSECPSNSPHDQNTLEISHADFEKTWEVFRYLILFDKDVLLKASSAFVSFIRAYKEHQLQFIFPFKELEIGEFATSLSLLRIPRVREILGKTVKGFTQSTIDPQSIQFRDRGKAVTFKLLRECKKKAESENKQKMTSQAKKKETGKEKQHRTRSEKRRAKRRHIAEEWEELALEEKLYKKLRRGRITEEEYEKRLAHTFTQCENESVGCNKNSDPPGSDNEGIGQYSQCDENPSSDTVLDCGKIVNSKERNHIVSGGKEKKKRILRGWPTKFTKSQHNSKQKR